MICFILLNPHTAYDSKIFIFRSIERSLTKSRKFMHNVQDFKGICILVELLWKNHHTLDLTDALENVNLVLEKSIKHLKVDVYSENVAPRLILHLRILIYQSIFHKQYDNEKWKKYYLKEEAGFWFIIQFSGLVSGTRIACRWADFGKAGSVERRVRGGKDSNIFLVKSRNP